MSEEEKPEIQENTGEDEGTQDSGEEEAPQEEVDVDESVEAEETPEEPEVVEVPEEEEIYYEDAVNKGDFIKVEFTGRVKETGEVFETTDEELAREEGIWNEDTRYGPRLVVVGEGWVLRGLDKRLPGLKVSQKAEIEIPPEEAFGERNTNLVQMVPYRVLRSRGINPVVGAELEIEGRAATIRSIGSGRVQVDYNHPLAGRNIVYEVEVIEQLEEDEEKINALIARRFIGVEPEKFNVRKLKTKIRIEIPDEIFFGENIQIAKRGLALDLLRYFEEPRKIEFIETIERS